MNNNKIEELNKKLLEIEKLYDEVYDEYSKDFSDLDDEWKGSFENWCYMMSEKIKI
jgi:hypothetical protein